MNQITTQLNTLSNTRTVLFLKKFGVYIAATLATIAAIIAYRAELTAFFSHYLNFGGVLGFAMTWLVLLLPLLLVFLGHALPALIKHYLDRRLRKLGLEGAAMPPVFFRVTPLALDDKFNYKRFDEAHLRIEQWLTQSPESLLYLSGRSGVGKSSMLEAWLQPQLQNQHKPPFAVLSLRTSGDPCQALRNAIAESPLLDHGYPPEAGLYSQLERITSKLVRKRLFIVFDSFEEVLIAPNNPQRAVFTQLLHDLVEKPLPLLKMLIVCRSDYLALFESCGMPPLRQSQNWQELLPFSDEAARDFFARSSLALEPEQATAVLNELRAFDETADLIRPMSLNLAGLVIGQYGKIGLRRARLAQWIHRYLQQSWCHWEIANYSTRLLIAMITQRDTVKPVSTAELSAQCQSDVRVMRGVLLKLQQRGLVRLLPNDDWEIAHDFIANQTARLLPHFPKPSRWTHLTLGFVFAVWLLMFAIGKEWAGTFAQQNLFKSLIYAHEVDQQNYEVDISSLKRKDISHLWQEMDLLQWRKPITKLTISRNYNLQQLPAFNNLSQLSTLFIQDNDALQHLPDFDQLPHLQSLSIDGNYNLKSLPVLDKLPQLQTLLIENNYKLENLPDLDQLPQLQQLSIGWNNHLQQLRALNNLPQLQSLAIRDNEKLNNLPDLNNLSQLQSLFIESNHHLQSLPALDKLPQLQMLSIGYNTSLKSLPPLNNLPQLQNLSIWNNANLNALPDLNNLPQLKQLSIYNNEQLQQLSKINLPNIERLLLFKNGSTFNLAAIATAMPNLRWLCVGNEQPDIGDFKLQRQKANLAAVKIQFIENGFECRKDYN